MNDLTRFNPFRNDDWLKGFWVSPFAGEMESAPQIKIDLTENDKIYTVRADITGVKKEDIKVTWMATGSPSVPGQTGKRGKDKVKRSFAASATKGQATAASAWTAM